MNQMQESTIVIKPLTNQNGAKEFGIDMRPKIAQMNQQVEKFPFASNQWRNESQYSYFTFSSST